MLKIEDFALNNMGCMGAPFTFETEIFISAVPSDWPVIICKGVSGDDRTPTV